MLKVTVTSAWKLTAEEMEEMKSAPHLFRRLLVSFQQSTELAWRMGELGQRLEKEKGELEKEKGELGQRLEKEKGELGQRFEKEKGELGQRLEKEKGELEKEKGELEKEKGELALRLEKEKGELALRLEKEKGELGQRLEKEQGELGSELKVTTLKLLLSEGTMTARGVFEHLLTKIHTEEKLAGKANITIAYRHLDTLLCTWFFLQTYRILSFFKSFFMVLFY